MVWMLALVLVLVLVPPVPVPPPALRASGLRWCHHMSKGMKSGVLALVPP